MKQPRVWGSWSVYSPSLLHTPHPWEGRKPPPRQPSSHCPLIPFHSQLCAASRLVRSAVTIIPLTTKCGLLYSKALCFSVTLFCWLCSNECEFMHLSHDSFVVLVETKCLKTLISCEKPTACCESGYSVTCWQPVLRLAFTTNGINLLLSISFPFFFF